MFGADYVKEVTVPTVTAAYNDEMNSVDIGDQLRAYAGFDHRVRRGGWQALAWTFLLDTSLINSYLLQLKGKPNWKPYKDQVSWRRQLIDELIAAYSKTGTSRQRFRAGDEFTPILQHKHVNRGKISACLACQGHKLGQPRSQSQRRPLGALADDGLNRRPKKTRWGCETCNVALCNQRNCWDFYHSVN